jgi:nucleoside-diphosphate-sugar epimerase
MGNVRYSVEHAQEYTAVNIGGTVNLLEAARLSDTRYFVFASTSSVYGNAPFHLLKPSRCHIR